jgi:membrane-bound serine protease (ClpP class)
MDNLVLAYLLIALGVIFLIAELFLPSGGVLFILSALSVLAGVALVFVYGDSFTGMITLVVAFVALPFIGAGVMYLWPHTPLAGNVLEPSTDVTVAAMAEIVELEKLRGRYGKTVSMMRPSGVVNFDGRRIDAITEGMMLPVDQWVRCIDVKSGKVIVRAVPNPNLGTFDTEYDEGK